MATDTTTANNYACGVYQDGEVYIQTEPNQLNANGGKVYLTVRELRRLLALVDNAPVRNRIVVAMEGGVIQSTLADHPEQVEIRLIDYDVESADEADLSDVPQGNGKTAKAYVANIDADAINPDWSSQVAALAPRDALPDNSLTRELYKNTDALDEIHGLMDGTQWNADTLEAIADALTSAGYTLRPYQEG